MESVLQLEEILETIFQFLRPSDLKSAASVCRFWSETAKNDSLWRVLCEKFMYPVSEHESALDVFRESFVSWSPEPGRSTTHKMQSHSQGVRGVDFIERTDPAESVFVAAADDGCVSLWNSVTFGRRAFMQTESKAGINVVKANRSGNLVLTGDDNGYAYFFDVVSGATDAINSVSTPRRVRALAWRDDSTAWVSCDNGSCYLADVRTRHQPLSFTSHGNNSVCALIYDAARQTVITGAFDNRVALTDDRKVTAGVGGGASDGEAARFLPLGDTVHDHCWGLDMDEQGNLFCVFADRQLQVWNAAATDCLFVQPLIDSPRCVSVLGGRVLISGDKGNIEWLDNWRRTEEVVSAGTAEEMKSYLRQYNGEMLLHETLPWLRVKKVASDWTWVSRLLPGARALVGCLDKALYCVQFHGQRVGLSGQPEEKVVTHREAGEALERSDDDSVDGEGLFS